MGEIADVIGGGTPKTGDSKNYENGTIPWLTPADLSGYTSKYIEHGRRFITQKGLSSSSARMMPAGTVLFSSRAPVGYVVIARNDICTNQGFKSFVLNGEVICSDYVYWWLKGAKGLAESMASGTTFLELSGAKAKKIPVPIAPIDQQKRIVEEIEKQFSRLDEAVANLKRVKANLKRYRASVLQVAVTGKLTEEWRKQHLPAPVTEPGKFYTYAILCEDESIYIGHTNDIERHWREHREGQGAEWTKEHKPVKIVHYEAFDSREEAAEREKWLKTGFGRKWIKRELAAGRTRQAGDVEPASKLLERILTERRQKWEETELAHLRERHARGQARLRERQARGQARLRERYARGQAKIDGNWQPKNDKWKEKYKEPAAPDASGLPPLPGGWVWSSLEQLAEPAPHALKAGPFGSSLKKAYYVPNGYKVYGQEQVIRNDHSYGDYYINEERYEKLKSCAVKPNDMLISLVGTIGQILILPEDIEPGIINPRLVKISLNRAVVSPLFIKAYLQSSFVKYLFAVASHGGTMDILNLTILKGVPIPLPSLDEQHPIIQETESRLSVAEEIERTVDANLLRAERLRQSILKQAFSGKLV